MLKQKLIVTLIAAAFAVPALAQAPKANDKAAVATEKKADKAPAEQPVKKSAKKGKAKAKGKMKKEEKK
ncbi:MAG TPA: hypothetical protein VN747_03885 [Burkholderiales bacterium]|jgi:hypothetical protein|nr:hypothetical protein [Burkholderiales bacterium]